jgi:hypothetical protein
LKYHYINLLIPQDISIIEHRNALTNTP